MKLTDKRYKVSTIKVQEMGRTTIWMVKKGIIYGFELGQKDGNILTGIPDGKI